MKTPTATLVFPFLVGTIGAAASMAAGASTPFDIDARVQQVLDDWRVPGAVVVVIADGEVADEGAYGVSSLETQEPVSVDGTVFRLASISKPVTASAVMRLVEEERLDLDRDVNDYLKRLRSEGPGTLTTRHLLTHTGGFEDRILNRMTRAGAPLPALHEYLDDELPARRYAPGEVSLYSNHGMALAGLLVQDLVGEPFPRAMRRLVFEPLGMQTATFELPATATLPGAVFARGHRFGEPVAVLGIKTIPASMLAATARDITRWMKALLSSTEGSFLEASTVTHMLSRQFEHHPTFTGRALGLSEDASVVPRRLLHSGGTDGFSSALVLIPEARGGIFVAFNGNAYVWDLVRSILDARFPADPTQETMTQDPVPRPTARSPVGAGGRYVPAAIPSSSLDKARLLFEQTSVKDHGSGVVHRGELYERIGDHDDGVVLYRSARGDTLVSKRGSLGEMFLFEQSEAWIRLPWYLAWQLHLVLIIVLCGAFTWVAAGRFHPRDELVGWSRGALRLAAALLLAFVLAMGSVVGLSMSQGGGALRFGFPWYLTALLALPPVALALAGISILHPSRWRQPSWKAARSLLLLLPFLGFAGFLSMWNLLGWRY